MKVHIGCPEGKYDENMRIRCRKSGTLCAHQYWCGCDGRCKLTERAKDCPGREDRKTPAKFPPDGNLKG